MYKTTERNFGYNLQVGGISDNRPIEEICKKISDKVTASYTDELRYTKKQLALKQWANPEIKAKIMGSGNGMYGKSHTAEARKKISEKAKGRISNHRNTTPVLCVETNTIYSCAYEAGKELNCKSPSSSILQVCYGKRKTCGGYHWKFLLENNI